VTLRRREAVTGLLFISPWLVGFLVFTLGPMAATFYLSFTEYSILGDVEWIGLANYRRAFGEDERVGIALFNTAYFMFVSVPLTVALGLVLALGVNNRLPGMTLFRAAFYLPVVVPIVPTVIVWVFVLGGNTGVVNYALELVGIPGPNWLGSTTWSKPAIILISLWHAGSYMVIFLGGLQGISEQLYEAAKLDGAGVLARFRHVTLPMMTPTIFFNLVLGLIASSQVFATSLIATGGGPLRSTYFMLLMIYEEAFQFFHMGYAAALAWLMFLLVLAMTALIFRTARAWVYYES
jgi:multiple sugar transport system permease protein